MKLFGVPPSLVRVRNARSSTRPRGCGRCRHLMGSMLRRRRAKNSGNHVRTHSASRPSIVSAAAIVNRRSTGMQSMLMNKSGIGSGVHAAGATWPVTATIVPKKQDEVRTCAVRLEALQQAALKHACPHPARGCRPHMGTRGSR